MAAIPHISLTVNGETKEILMSFGLIREFTALLTDDVGDVKPERLLFDPQLRDMGLKMLLVPRTNTGRPEIPVESVDLYDYLLDPEEIAVALASVVEHVTNFFRGLFTALQKTQKSIEETLQGQKAT